jgi:CheY-like chemotaxis protein
MGVEGIGLGLALSKHLVDAMSGTLAVESQPGAGSTFSVELPVAAPPLETALPRPWSAMAGAAGAGPRAVVLYIEDNLSNLRLVEQILARRPGVRLVSAMQGRVGVDLACEHRPHIILLDQHLPDVNGDVVLQRLAADPRTREIPVVMLSADASPRQVQRLRDLGARDYLTKPLEVQRLLAVIDAALLGAAAAPPASSS